MGRRGWAAVLLTCLLVATATLGRAWTPAPPPAAGVQVSQVPLVGAAPPGPQEVPAREGPPPPPAATQPPAAETVAEPVRLQVAALGIDAVVAPVGVADDGQMEVPADGAVVGWYRHGPAPGAAQGSAVLAGHVDTRADGPGAFFRLAELEPGAEVLVTDAGGHRLRYAVVGRERVAKDALPVEAVFARDGPPRLTLVTCGGAFDGDRGRYLDNVVVVAELVHAAP